MTVLSAIFTHWPVPTSVVIIIAIATFRKPIASVIDRAKRLKVPGGTEISVTPKQDDSPRPQPVAEAVALTDLPLPLPLMRHDSFLVQELTRDLKKQVDLKFPDNLSDREKYLIDIAADALATGLYEWVYATIYGSQLVAVRDLNSAGVVHVAVLNCYFDDAKANFANLYETDSFDRWLAWLTDVSFLVERKDAEQIAISAAGRDFLQFVISRGYRFVKPG